MDEIDQFLHAAVKRGYISQPQADNLKEELFMFPGQNMLNIVLRRGLLTNEQYKALEDSLLEEEVAPPEHNDFKINPTFSAPPPKVEPEAPLPPQKPMASRLSDAIAMASQAAGAAPVAQPAARTPLDSPNARPLFSSSPVSAPAVPALDGVNPDPLMLKYFQAGRDRECSDLHITIGKPPYLRQNGRLYFLDEPVVTPQMAEKLCLSVLNEVQKAIVKQDLQLDFSCGFNKVGRFRANVYRQRLGYEGSFRFIGETIPTMDELGLPKVLEKLTTYTQGLNLVTGPGGSGKTSTVAAMLQYVNCHRDDHIITVEDPVEYIFVPDHCQITQREVGRHTESFAAALRTALRQDPDVIMIGELRDLETTSISITAAETGHLVFGTLHTSSAIRTVARILDVYPPSQRSQICLMVAESLRGIMSQQLVDRKDGKGRVCAMEVLLVTTGVAQVIKEGKTHQLVSHMQSGRRLGMVSMDDALMDLYRSGVITGLEAYNRAENKSAFENFRNEK
jgi:twitching motility protein PilT